MSEAMKAWSDEVEHELWQGAHLHESVYWFWSSQGVGRQW